MIFLKTFTDIMVLINMNMCQIVSIYVPANKNYGKKTVVTVEPGTGSIVSFKFVNRKAYKLKTTYITMPHVLRYHFLSSQHYFLYNSPVLRDHLYWETTCLNLGKKKWHETYHNIRILEYFSHLDKFIPIIIILGHE